MQLYALQYAERLCSMQRISDPTVVLYFYALAISATTTSAISRLPFVFFLGCYHVALLRCSVLLYCLHCTVQFPGDLYLLAGDFTEGGEYATSVYRSLKGIHCDINGVICNNQ